MSQDPCAWKEPGTHCSPTLILYRLDELKRDIDSLSGQVHELGGKLNGQAVDVAKLNVKAGAWGAIGGAVVTAAAAVYALIK